MDREKKVLIVDDNETVLLALEYNIGQAGYKVLKASDGEKALALAMAEQPDIIVSDITMPEMDGIELCKKIRTVARFVEIPFIFLTAHGGLDERVRGLRSGADDYIVKPFDIEELIVRIDILYRKIQQRRFSHTLSGNLKELSIADTLQIFAQARKEGNLVIRADGKAGLISFRDGDIMDASFMELSGEDALVELMMLTDGNFNYEPQEVVTGTLGKPVNYMMFEVIRLIDERSELTDFIPDLSRKLAIAGKSAGDDPELVKLENAIQGGAATGLEVQKVAGMSRIRTELGLARLIRDGLLKSEDGPVAVAVSEPSRRTNGKPVRVLFVFTDESAAATFLENTADAFHAQGTRGIKAGIADFLKINIETVSFQIYSLRGGKKFSFLWEPMLPTSEIAIFLMNSENDREHLDYFRSKLAMVKDIPLHVVTLNPALPEETAEFLAHPTGFQALFRKVLNFVA